MQKWSKKQVFLCLIFIIAIAICFCIVYLLLKGNSHLTPYEQIGQKLSELSESECQKFIVSKGVQIPSDLNTEDIGGFVKEIICRAEQYPQSQCGFSYTETVNFAEAIRKIVNEYYGIDGGAYLIE